MNGIFRLLLVYIKKTMTHRSESQLAALRAANAASSQDALDRVLRAVVALASEKEWADITVSDIVRVSTVSRSAFYRHYKSKDEVIDKSMAEVGARIVAVNHENSMELWIHIFDEVMQLRPLREVLIKSNAFDRVLHFLNDLITEDMSEEERIGQLIWNGACYNLVTLYLTEEIDLPPQDMARLTAHALARPEAGEVSPLLRSKSTDWLENFRTLASGTTPAS